MLVACVMVPLALLIAQALNTRGLRGSDMFRIVYFAPIVVSPILVVLIFRLFFDRKFGLVNAVLRALFGPAVSTGSATRGWPR